MGYFKTIGGVTTPLLQKENYWFKNNGKTITQAEYCKIQSEIGDDETKGAGLQTNHPDACGLKAKREKERKKKFPKKETPIEYTGPRKKRKMKRFIKDLE